MKNLFFLLTTILFLIGCKKENSTPGSTLENTYGFGVLEKVRGIWNGPVSSTTALGSFPEWIVDFRPIAENHISAKNELDTVNDIFMSFFIAKYHNEYKVAFRNGGGFAGMQRISYFLADSVYETSAESYYRFSEIINGPFRAYTEVMIKGDSLKIHSYTNRYNTQTSPTLHMQWNAKLQDRTSSDEAKNTFGFPNKTLARDMTNSFAGLTETIIYNEANDPFNEASHPYLGSATISYSFSGGFTPDANKKVLLMLTTRPLFNGFNFSMNNLKFRSRYVLLSADDTEFTFNYLHPGTYYVYALYDNDGNLTFNSGDRVSTSNSTFTLTPNGNASGSASINFVIP